jgi:hypothetical protein
MGVYYSKAARRGERGPIPFLLACPPFPEGHGKTKDGGGSTETTPLLTRKTYAAAEKGSRYVVSAEQREKWKDNVDHDGG